MCNPLNICGGNNTQQDLNVELHWAKEMISITVSATERHESVGAVQCMLLVNLCHSSR